MKKFDIQMALGAVAEAKAKWAKHRAEFESGVDAVMFRLLHEAAANYMSAEEVARASGFTTAQIKKRMKAMGMNPVSGKRLLAKQAAEALATNSAILGIEPHEMDLMSPLAYLPAGSLLRQEIQANGVSDINPCIHLEPEQYERLARWVEAAQDQIPVSIESLVHLAIDGFIEGLDE